MQEKEQALHTDITVFFLHPISISFFILSPTFDLLPSHDVLPHSLFPRPRSRLGVGLVSALPISKPLLAAPNYIGKTLSLPSLRATQKPDKGYPRGFQPGLECIDYITVLVSLHHVCTLQLVKCVPPECRLVRAT